MKKKQSEERFNKVSCSKTIEKYIFNFFSTIMNIENNLCVVCNEQCII